MMEYAKESQSLGKVDGIALGTGDGLKDRDVIGGCDGFKLSIYLEYQKV